MYSFFIHLSNNYQPIINAIINWLLTQEPNTHHSNSIGTTWLTNHTTINLPSKPEPQQQDHISYIINFKIHKHIQHHIKR